MGKSDFCNFFKMANIARNIERKLLYFSKKVHDLNNKTHFGEQISRRRINSHFRHFRKFRVIRENRTYVILTSTFYPILTVNLKKKIGAVFEKILKMAGGLDVKYPPKFKYVSNSRAHEIRQINFGENRFSGLVARVVHRRTDVLLSIGFFRYQGPTK